MNSNKLKLKEISENKAESPYFSGKPSHTLLIVDDESLVLNALEATLSHAGYKVKKAPNGKEALAVLKKEPISVIICDLNMPEMKGQEVLKEARKLQPDAIRIVLTAVSDLKTLAELINEVQISQFLLKPWDEPLLIQIVEDSIKRLELILENRHLQELTQNQHATLQKELHVGGVIHQTLLLGEVPREIQGVSLEVFSQANKEIDGDFFGFYRPAPFLLDVVIGDVMGKGLPAAMVGTAVKTEFTRYASPFCPFEQFSKTTGWQRPWLETEEILEHVHQEIVTSLIELEYFVSLTYGRFDLSEQTFTFIDCGATKPLHYHAKDGTIETLSGENFPLGVIDQSTYQESTTSYEVGDLFLFYSDGVTEAHGPEGDLYGVERLLPLILKTHHLSSQEILDAITEDLRRFMHKETFDDDITVMALKMDEIHTDPDWIKRRTVRFSSELSQLKAVREIVRQFLKEAAPKNVQPYPIELIINEAFCNVVKHGYQNESGKPIKLTMSYGKGELLLDLADQGRPFRPSEIEDPNFFGSESRGFGLFLIKQICDTVHYSAKQSKGGWNHLSLTKTLHQHEEVMNLTHKNTDKVLTIVLEGKNLDAKEAPIFKQQVIDLVSDTDSHQVVLDLQQLHFIDSSGLGSFLSLLRALKTKGGELKMAGMTDQIRTIFELVCMHKIFEIYNNTDEAVRSFH